MSKPTITIHNTVTDEYETREMNAQELTQWETDVANYAIHAQAQNEIQAKREAALAKLASLGLEPDDLKAVGL